MANTEHVQRRSCNSVILRVFAVLVAAGGVMADANAVFTFTPLDSPRQVTLRVGSADSVVNTVTFDVNNAKVSPSPVPVTGVSGGGAPPGGIEIEVVTRMPGLIFGNNTMTLSATYPANLTCAGGGCGSTAIPFSTIKWTSANQGPATGCTAGGAANDIKDGIFNGSGQQLARCSVSDFLGFTGRSVTMLNVLTFEYSNATLYPSGNYEGRVVFTATNN